MHLKRLWLHQFRCHTDAELSFPDGLTVVHGANATGKSSILEAIGYLATLRSFRGAPVEALVALGSDRAVARAEVERDAREVLLEAEIVAAGRNRFLINKQPLRRHRDLGDVLRISAFSPDDLVLVKGGPGERREYLDALIANLRPRDGELVDDVERILRQRNALLKQAGGRLTEEIGFTLDVWDAKLASAGTALGEARVSALDALGPELARAYEDVAGAPGGGVVGSYASAWWGRPGGLGEALAQGRADDVRRAITLIGPHRDDVELTIGGRASRTHASQGEQRTLALALRLAAHRLVTTRLGSAPVLLLDDVFSELDPSRSAALLRHLPVGQAVLATAGAVPEPADVACRLTLPLTGSFGTGPVVGPAESGASVEKPVETVDDTTLKGFS